MIRREDPVHHPSILLDPDSTNERALQKETLPFRVFDTPRRASDSFQRIPSTLASSASILSTRARVSSGHVFLFENTSKEAGIEKDRMEGRDQKGSRR